MCIPDIFVVSVKFGGITGAFPLEIRKMKGQSAFAQGYTVKVKKPKFEKILEEKLKISIVFVHFLPC